MTPPVALVSGTALALAVVFVSGTALALAVVLVSGTDPANDLCPTVGAGQSAGIAEIVTVTAPLALEVAEADCVYGVHAW